MIFRGDISTQQNLASSAAIRDKLMLGAPSVQGNSSSVAAILDKLMLGTPATQPNVSPAAFCYVQAPPATQLYFSSSINYSVSNGRSQIHKGDNGVLVDVLLINGSITLDATFYFAWVAFKKPSGAVLDKPAYLVNQPGNNRINCVLQGTDVDEVGKWQLQPILRANGKLIHGTIESFEVLESIL